MSSASGVPLTRTALGALPETRLHNVGSLAKGLDPPLLPPELRTIYLPPQPSLPITRHQIHPLSITPGPSTQSMIKPIPCRHMLHELYASDWNKLNLGNAYITRTFYRNLAAKL